MIPRAPLGRFPTELPPMYLLLTLSMILTGAPPDSPPVSAGREASVLKNIQQVTYGFARAGEGYFRPDGKAIIFQAVSNPAPLVLLGASPTPGEYQIFTANLSPLARPKMVSTGEG